MPKTGFFLINKPAGPTSHDIINQLRRLTGIKKIGHAGTLDPFASGLLIVAVGREATREICKYVKLDKEYVATLHLGAETDSYDKTGKLTTHSTQPITDADFIRGALKKFVGKQLQIPPMFSAKKINGRKLYELARAGREIERAPAEIEIFSLDFVEYAWPYLKIRVHVSSGTYIRTLAFDIGRALGVGAYLEELCRTKIGNFALEQAKSLGDINSDKFYPVDKSDPS